MLEGDIIHGAVGSGDSQDGVNLQGLTLGQTYIISFNFDDTYDTATSLSVNSANALNMWPVQETDFIF
ncbi:hypothetical protein [uncultured Sulfitobacter sp.]|uniref:hypothetical protein n=1 Tax=uncultured Sulfitobacter sp. TaxID=191468 RepID=UPI0026038CDB|nr:hypothetical protein [uncultured Sulfitobacter sp.]